MDMTLGDTRLIISECMKQGLLRNQAAYVLATAFLETGYSMSPVKEAYHLQTRYNWTDERMEKWRKDNLRYHPWYGRGYVQLTWERNYHKAGEALGIDLTTDADAVMEPDVAVAILVIGSRDGWFTGKKLSDYITLERSNFRGARRIINGTDKAGAIAEFARDYDKALKLDGYGVEPDIPVVDDRRDGSAPRNRRAQSKTIWAQVLQWAGAAVAAALPWFDTQSDGVQIAAIIGAAVVVASGLIVFRERLKHWADGVR